MRMKTTVQPQTHKQEAQKGRRVSHLCNYLYHGFSSVSWIIMVLNGLYPYLSRDVRVSSNTKRLHFCSCSQHKKIRSTADTLLS